MNSRKIASYFPRFYDGYVEIDALATAEDKVFDKAEQEAALVFNNLFILTADAEGIQEYENQLGILADPATESLEFRRARILNRFSLKPPYTYRFLEQKLNDIIGVGQWTMNVDYANRTLYIESSSSDQQWFNEVLITLTGIKPANMVFINTPLTVDQIKLSEQVEYGTWQYNYKLGTTWQLGQKPFADFENRGIAKLPTTPSVTPALLNSIVTFAVEDVASVLINNSVVITDFTTQSAAGNVATLAFDVNVAQTSQITNIKIRDASDTVLTNSTVWIPIVDSANIKHTLTVREGV